jgi:hypothetical protein
MGLLLSSLLDLLIWGSLLCLLSLAPGVLGFVPDSFEPPTVTCSIVYAAWMIATALVQAVGAVMMRRLRWYPLAAAATILAMLPGSPTFVISLPVGIWSCIVLGKPEVTAAFFDPRHSPVDEPAGEPDPQPRMVGRVLSYVRSVCGYFLPTMAGRTMKNEG